MKKMYYAGIDYHKHYSTVCILDADRSVVAEARVRPNTKNGFADVFSRVDGPVRTTFECGLNWERLFDILESLPMVSDVVLANALQTRRKRVCPRFLVFCKMFKFNGIDPCT